MYDHIDWTIIKMAENYITCQAEKGSINISEDVVVAMVRSVINELEGVAALSDRKSVGSVKGVPLSWTFGGWLCT